MEVLKAENKRGDERMEIRRFEDLKRNKVIWDGGWFLNTFTLRRLEKIKENEKSFRFRVTETILRFEKFRLVSKETRRYETTIKTDKILFSKIPCFTKKEEAVKYFVERLIDTLEDAKLKVKNYPVLINDFKLVFKDVIKEAGKDGNKV